MTAVQEKQAKAESGRQKAEDVKEQAEQAQEVNLGSIAQIPPGEGRKFHVAGRDIAVFRARSGSVYATQSACPHRNGPLVDGILGGSVLVCPLHAWKWDLTTGKPLMGDCDLTTYAVRLTDAGDIMLLS